jgi:hypothetical protein
MVLLPALVTAQTVEGRLAAGGGLWANHVTWGGIVQGSGGLEVRIAGQAGVAAGAGIILAGELVVPLSVDAVWHPEPPGGGGRVDPFVAVGFVSLNGRVAWQIRGGISQWRGPLHALRFELQWIKRTDSPGQAVIANIGVTFR